MPLTYHQSGVNYHLMDDFKNACIKAGGNSPQILEFDKFFLVDVLEGLGSLGQLADDIYSKTQKDFYYQVGWGNAATILNDLIALGAKPLTLKLFVGAGNEKWFADQKRYQNLIKGFQEAAKYSNCFWNGGETQTLVGVINKKSIVLAGSSTGIVQPKSNLIDDQNLREGDAIIFFESSGLHTNGITLVRKIFKNQPEALIEAIKAKTIIYSPLIQELLNHKIKIHFATHITGHGWRKIMRSKQSFTYRINKIPQPQKIFNLIQQKAKLTNFQMYSDYNMGLGYAIFVNPTDQEKVLTIAKKLKFKAFVGGVIEKGPRQVLIEPLGITLDGKDLKIR